MKNLEKPKLNRLTKIRGTEEMEELEILHTDEGMQIGKKNILENLWQ